MARPLLFGIQTPQQHVAYEEISQVWKSAASLGYDSAWVFDHFLPGRGDPTGPCLEAMVLVTALAVENPSLRAGVLVLGNGYRHPAVLANMLATQDIVTNGRLEIGMGAGWFQLEYDAYGIPFPRPGVRIAELDEAVQVIKLLLTENKANFKGKYYNLTDAPCDPKPVQKPHPPIWIGGAGKRTMRVAAQHADGWNTFLLPLEDYRGLLKVLDEHCSAIGRDPSTIQKSLAFAMAIGRTGEEASRKLEKYPEARRPVVVGGTPESCIARLKQYASLGVNHFIINMDAPYDFESLELFAKNVLPAFR